MENIGYYAAMLAAIIIAFLIIKRAVTCMVKTVVTLILVAVLAYIYFMYLR